MKDLITCKVCNKTGNGYCAEHSTSGTAYEDMEIKLIYGNIWLLERRKIKPEGKFVIIDSCQELGWYYYIVGAFYLIGVATVLTGTIYLLTGFRIIR